MHPRSMALILATVAAGCVQAPHGPPAPLAHPLLAGPALWDDPQDAPHPKWGWATLSNPPPGDLPAWWTPIARRPLPQPIVGLEHLGQVTNFSIGAGLALFGHVAVVPEDSQFAHFVDISDPAHPREVGRIDSGGRGAAIIAYPDGRLVTAISTTPGFDVIDFTDPTHPVMVNQTVVPVQGGHKLGIVPGTPILYNAASRGGGATPLLGPSPCNVDIRACTGYTEIYNLTDPEHPRLVQDFQNGLSCHHIFFWNNATAGKYRAICAGVQYTQLWDTADPEHPRVIVSLPVHSGEAGTPSVQGSIEDFSHSAGLNRQGTVLYVGDENGGGGAPPGCVAGTDSAPGDAGTPVGATWFYNVSDESHPSLLGYFAPPRDSQHNAGRSCTTHHGRLVPDPHRDLLAMSYYQDGVILVDFTGIDASKGILPKVVDEFSQGSDTWETWYDQGYLFTGDLARGMDSFTLR
ncbi:MAG: LVIVD repeat-containing protein [Thermoplasmatota archaeon]